MPEIICKRCGSNKIILKSQSMHEGIYCKDCDCWIKWIKRGTENTDIALKKQLAASKSPSAIMQEEQSVISSISKYSEVPDVSSTTQQCEIEDVPFDVDESSAYRPINNNKEPEHKPVTLLIHGPVELEFSDGRRIWVTDNSKLVVAGDVLKEYKIATEELIREIKYY